MVFGGSSFSGHLLTSLTSMVILEFGMGIALIFTLYAIVTVLSIGGGYLPTYFETRRV